MSRAKRAANGLRPLGVVKDAFVLHETRRKANPKYANVQSTMRNQTGRHAENRVKKKDYSNECFKRVKTRTVNQLMTTNAEEEESIYNYDLSDGVESTITSTTVDDLGDFGGDAGARGASSSDFLLVDVRDDEAYAQCHLDGALSYPVINLRRDKYPPALYRFKNAADKIIILYCDDAREQTTVGTDAAVAFTHKDFNNVYLLTGGLAAMAHRYPDRVVGELPEHIVASVAVLQAEADARAARSGSPQKLTQASLARHTQGNFHSSGSSSRMGGGGGGGKSRYGGSSSSSTSGSRAASVASKSRNGRDAAPLAGAWR